MALKNILLLGGSGFVGGHIAHLLSHRGGLEITIPTRRLERSRDLLPLPGVHLVEADINDPGVLLSLVKGQDGVINLVGILHSDSAQPYGKAFARAHVALPKKVVAAMKQAGVRRLLHMSALKADVQGPSEYLRSKGEGEAVVLAAKDDLDVTVFRPSVIFGQGDSFLTTFARLLRKAPLFPLGYPFARFQPVFVEDVARAFVDSLEDPTSYGRSFDLCGPQIYTLRQLVEYVGKVTGYPRPVVRLPEMVAYLQAGLMALAPRPLMSPDNLRSLQVDNVAEGRDRAPAGWLPTALEAVGPAYLNPHVGHAKLDSYRYRARR